MAKQKEYNNPREFLDSLRRGEVDTDALRPDAEAEDDAVREGEEEGEGEEGEEEGEEGEEVLKEEEESESSEEESEEDTEEEFETETEDSETQGEEEKETKFDPLEAEVEVKYKGQPGQKVKVKDLVRQAQIYENGHHLAQQGRQAQKDAQYVLEQIARDPIGTALNVLYEANSGDITKAQESLFQEANKFVEPFWQERLAAEEDPDRARYIRDKREFEGKRQAQKLKEEREKRRREQDEQARLVEEFNREIPRSLEKVGLPPDDPHVRKRLVDMYRDHVLEHDERPSLDDMAELVNNELKQGLENLLRSTSTEKLIEMYPDLKDQIIQSASKEVKQKKEKLTPGRKKKSAKKAKPRKRTKKVVYSNPLEAIRDRVRG